MCRDSNRYRVDNGDSSDTGQVSPVELCGSGDSVVRVLHCIALHLMLQTINRRSCTIENHGEGPLRHYAKQTLTQPMV